jgi:hypothetical protein
LKNIGGPRGEEPEIRNIRKEEKMTKKGPVETCKTVLVREKEKK